MRNPFKNFGSYKAFCKCPNCGFGSEIRVPRAISVADFIKGGKCKCDSCGVVFFPDEYTTEWFEKDKLNKKEGIIKKIKEKLEIPKREKRNIDIKW